MQESVIELTFLELEPPNTMVSHKLLSQIVWYFIEGFNNRFDEYPVLTSIGFTKYTVALSDIKMVFYQSEKVIDGGWK